ncbi:hypothetical protein F2P79_008944 [Pimephales promelas]|nr:hypothetical protein F2P79_008944 [Pimephales promelas]
MKIKDRGRDRATPLLEDADELCSTLYLTLCIYCTSLKDPWRDPLESREKRLDSTQCWVPTRTLCSQKS